MKILVILENVADRVKPASWSAVEFARQVAAAQGGQVAGLVMGHNVAEVATKASSYLPVHVVDDAALAQPLAETHAAVIVQAVSALGAAMVVAASTSWSKDVVGRAAGSLGGAMASEVIGHEVVEGTLRLRRPVYAGAFVATVMLKGGPRIVTVRSAAYAASTPLAVPATVTALAVTVPPAKGTFIGLKAQAGGRPDATEAAVVVSGGRAIKTADQFEALIGGLADKLGGAVGSSRALVDAGIAANDLQIGQTGKVVAPDLYVAVGLSGAIQHLAGMNGSRTVVAINKDREAPIFAVADIGYIGDVHQVVPELLKKLS